MAIIEPTQEQLDARIRDAGGVDTTINVDELNQDVPDLSDFPKIEEEDFLVAPDIEMPDVFKEGVEQRDVLQEQIVSLEEEISGYSCRRLYPSQWQLLYF